MRTYRHFQKPNVRIGPCPDNDNADVGSRCPMEDVGVETTKPSDSPALVQYKSLPFPKRRAPAVDAHCRARARPEGKAVPDSCCHVARDKS